MSDINKTLIERTPTAQGFFEQTIVASKDTTNWKAAAYLLAVVLSGDNANPAKTTTATSNWIEWAYNTSKSF